MRKGFEGLAALVQQHLDQDPFSGQLFAFRGRRGDLEKVLSWDKLSLRDLIRGIVFGCEAVRDWETKLSLALAENRRRRQRGKVGKAGTSTEPMSKSKAAGAISIAPSTGRVRWVRLSGTWDMAAACSAFCRVALRIGVIPQIKLYLLARNLTQPACADR